MTCVLRLGFIAIAVLASGLHGFSPAAAEVRLLQLESKITLGEVAGRIDHLAVDLGRQRLFVAELGNNTLGVVSLANAKLLRRLTGFSTPQGVGYDVASDSVYVANAGDGTVHVLKGEDYVALDKIELGKDADNIRIDAARRRVMVGYGSGALAIIDATTRRKVSDAILKGHPEGFQFDPQSRHIFVNLPDAHSIAVVDSDTAAQIAAWPQGARNGNFPMALDQAGRRVLTVFRSPATLAAFAMADGAPVAKIETCGDSDDVFVDAKRRRAYVSCGDGFIDVIDISANPLARLARIPTAPGARTSLFIPDLDRLVLAVPARGATPAAVWVFRPGP
jgi:DNA-binding beta-propeller fold protein YncE